VRECRARSSIAHTSARRSARWWVGEASLPMALTFTLSRDQGPADPSTGLQSRSCVD